MQAEQKTDGIGAFEWRKPGQKAFPDYMPRERAVVELASACSDRGSYTIVRIGEEMTETLEVIPRQWKVIQTVREKITRPPVSFHPIPRGLERSCLLVMIVCERHEPTAIDRP